MIRRRPLWLCRLAYTWGAIAKNPTASDAQIADLLTAGGDLGRITPTYVGEIRKIVELDALESTTRTPLAQRGFGT
jgi:hypothetical protein